MCLQSPLQNTLYSFCITQVVKEKKKKSAKAIATRVVSGRHKSSFMRWKVFESFY